MSHTNANNVAEQKQGVITATLVSVIIPTYNSARRIGDCLDSLLAQTTRHNVEIVVVNDGSTDATAEVVAACPSVKLVTQANAGPAAARNRGAMEARGEILLFTDDDCVPAPGWLEAMLQPFADPEVAGAKGTYRTRQKSLIARFVQIEYEDRYRLMAKQETIDFVDTYSAGFRRPRFLESGGYDTSFPVACAEDAELSYRMSALGWKMKFAPEAVVYHTHPDALGKYLRKKYKFAFWRVVAVRKNPRKAVRDSHTPQVMKFQLLLSPALLGAVLFDVVIRPRFPLSALVLLMFLASTAPFVVRACRKDRLVGLLSPGLLAVRACAQMCGAVAGLAYVCFANLKARGISVTKRQVGDRLDPEAR